MQAYTYVHTYHDSLEHTAQFTLVVQLSIRFISWSSMTALSVSITCAALLRNHINCISAPFCPQLTVQEIPLHSPWLYIPKAYERSVDGLVRLCRVKVYFCSSCTVFHSYIYGFKCPVPVCLVDHPSCLTVCESFLGQIHWHAKKRACCDC